MSKKLAPRNEETPTAATVEASDIHPTTTKGDMTHFDRNHEMNTSTIPALPQSITMSSREISELTGKEHKNVIRDIRKMLDEIYGNGGRLKFEQSYINEQNREMPEYLLDREHTDTLLTGYSAKLRQIVIRRWHELENNLQHPQIPQTMAEALRLAADQQEELERQRLELIAAAPKVAFADQVEFAHDAISVSEAAKTIGTGRTRLMAFLRQHGWVNRRNEPYQAKIESGLLDVKVSQWKHPDKGLREQVTTLVTGKGLVRLQRLWSESTGNAA